MGGSAEKTFCDLNPHYKTWHDINDIEIDNPKHLEYAVDWLYKGYTYRYGIVCGKESTRESYLMMTELIPAFIGLVASVLSDTYGRNKTFIVFSIFCLTGALVGAVFDYEVVKVIGLSMFIGEEAVLCT